MYRSADNRTLTTLSDRVFWTIAQTILKIQGSSPPPMLAAVSSKPSPIMGRCYVLPDIERRVR